MEIENYSLRPKPWWLRAYTKEWQWVTLDPRVYHPPRIDPMDHPAIIEHEKVHIAQQRLTGKYRWLIKYAISKRFRLEQEMEPIAVELSNTPLGARQTLAARYAKDLSGPPYSSAAGTAEAAMERIAAKAAEMGVELWAADSE
jgi:hypothetical protein